MSILKSKIIQLQVAYFILESDYIIQIACNQLLPSTVYNPHNVLWDDIKPNQLKVWIKYHRWIACYNFCA